MPMVGPSGKRAIPAPLRIKVKLCEQVRPTDNSCDGESYIGYIALFTNYAERPPFNYTGPHDDELCADPLFSTNPSGRVMPSKYFTFAEAGGDCTRYTQTLKVTGAIGFR